MVFTETRGVKKAAAKRETAAEEQQSVSNAGDLTTPSKGSELQPSNAPQYDACRFV